MPTSTTTIDNSDLVGIRMSISAEAIPVRKGKANLWVKIQKDTWLKSWKVYYAEEPFIDYVLGANYLTNPELFTITNDEVRVLIQDLTAGRRYKARVYGYDTSTQNNLDNYGFSRDILLPTSTASMEINYLELEATAIVTAINSGQGKVSLIWNNTERDDNGYDIEIILGGSGTINTERLPSGTKTYLVSSLADDTDYEFRLTKYDIDDNAVKFDSNTVHTVKRTAPLVPGFDSTMLTWIDQGPNSGDNQVVKVTLTAFDSGVYAMKVIAISGEGVTSSAEQLQPDIFYNRGVSDNQTVSYKLRAIDLYGNYSDSTIASIVIGNRTDPEGPTV